MTSWLIKRFVPNCENTGDGKVRTAYATLGATVGIAVNVLLAAAKFLMGVLSGSLAVTADAANNLSDAAGSIVALITTRMAQKPVDADHPFGHGRMEYLGSLAVGALIVVMAVSLLRDGVAAIFNPQPLTVSLVVVIVMVLSVGFKLWLYLFYRKLGKQTQNGTLLATSKDSLSDAIATGAVLLSMLLFTLFGWMIDGYIGVVVALLVLKAGYEVCRDTVDSLLGGKPDPEKIQQIRQMLMSNEGILGIHDLVLHDYGPGRCFASAHAEVSAKGDILAIHEMIDDAERKISRELNMPICIHMDPIVTDDENINQVRRQMEEFLMHTDASLSMHDFRMVPGQGHTNLIFDCVLPAGYKGRQELHQALCAYASSLDERYQLVVEYDTDYT
ncbi:MAG: cation transporter [Clostridiales bacterium]|nr:cation transporter [Clostridiales bacterium]